MLISQIEATLSDRFAPPVTQWDDPHGLIWYSWPLPHSEHGPRLSVRLVCPLALSPDGHYRSFDLPFEIQLIASAGRKTERKLCTLATASRYNWCVEVPQRLKLALSVMIGAPKCNNCGATMRPDRVKSTERLFWSCSRFPNCKGARRASKVEGRNPRTTDELTRSIC